MRGTCDAAAANRGSLQSGNGFEFLSTKVFKFHSKGDFLIELANHTKLLICRKRLNLPNMTGKQGSRTLSFSLCRSRSLHLPLHLSRIHRAQCVPTINLISRMIANQSISYYLINYSRIGACPGDPNTQQHNFASKNVMFIYFECLMAFCAITFDSSALSFK